MKCITHKHTIMIKEIEKHPKVALCRLCGGRGKSGDEICPQCEGSGRVTVSARMTLDIRPFRGFRPTTPTTDSKPLK